MWTFNKGTELLVVVDCDVLRVGCRRVGWSVGDGGSRIGYLTVLLGEGVGSSQLLGCPQRMRHWWRMLCRHLSTLLYLTVLGKKTNDEIVNLFGGDVCEPRLLELGDHVLVVAVAHVGSIQWGVNFVAGCVITACDGGGQDACDNQRGDSFHHVPQRMWRP